MGSFSIWHWLIVGIVVMLFFGGSGKISGVMGDFAKGIKAFKKGMSEDDSAKVEPLQTIDGKTGEVIQPQKDSQKS
jgi:sec-independent protein translocase protein TatA